MGLLCEECRDDLTSPLRISPEQVQTKFRHPTTAVLIDHWGRPHRLDPRTTIGRHVEVADDAEGQLLLLDASISRNHARLRHAGSTWTLEDLQSSNGSFLNDKPVSGVVPLATGNRLVFGDIGFYFVADLNDEQPVNLDPLAATTIRSQDRLRLVDVIPPGGNNDFEEAERTDAGLPQLDVRLSEPTGGGGGLVEVDGRQVQLTTTQYEFVVVLIKRMMAEAHQPDLVRGFVRSSELIADLSWDTKDPSENHVKQLVRRVRRALVKAEIGDLIESRHRFGYRLRAVPRLLQH